MWNAMNVRVSHIERYLSKTSQHLAGETQSQTQSQPQSQPAGRHYAIQNAMNNPGQASSDMFVYAPRPPRPPSPEPPRGARAAAARDDRRIHSPSPIPRTHQGGRFRAGDPSQDRFRSR